MVAVIIAWLALTASDTVHAALVIPALTMAAMVITWLALTASHGVVPTLVVTAFMMTAVVTARLAFATVDHPVVNPTIISTVTPFAMTAAVIAERRVCYLARGHSLHSVAANRIANTTNPRHRAPGDALMRGPIHHTPASTAKAHPGRARAMSFTRAAGE